MKKCARIGLVGEGTSHTETARKLADSFFFLSAVDPEGGWADGLLAEGILNAVSYGEVGILPEYRVFLFDLPAERIGQWIRENAGYTAEDAVFADTGRSTAAEAYEWNMILPGEREYLRYEIAVGEDGRETVKVLSLPENSARAKLVLYELGAAMIKRP